MPRTRSNPKNSPSDDIAAAQVTVEPAPTTIVIPDDPWRIVVGKLLESGWTICYNPPKKIFGSRATLIHWIYIRPDASIEEGTEGVDYFTAEANLQNYCVQRYNWNPVLAEKKDQETKKAADKQKYPTDPNGRKPSLIKKIRKKTQITKHLLPRTVTPEKRPTSSAAEKESTEVASLKALVEQQKKEICSLKTRIDSSSEQNIKHIIGERDELVIQRNNLLEENSSLREDNRALEHLVKKHYRDNGCESSGSTYRTSQQLHYSGGHETSV